MLSQTPIFLYYNSKSPVFFPQYCMAIRAGAGEGEWRIGSGVRNMSSGNRLSIFGLSSPTSFCFTRFLVLFPLSAYFGQN
jgi:hypothetical protein